MGKEDKRQRERGEGREEERSEKEVRRK